MPDAPRPSPADMVDWGLAATTGARLARSGPDVSYAEAAEVVAGLREAAEEAERHVGAFTRLSPPDDAPPPPPVLVVDRGEWVRRNVDGMRAATAPLLEALAAKSEQSKTPNKVDAAVGAVGRRVTGVQVGTLLAFLASRVLGQYEVFRPEGGSGGERPPGTLLLVAPNIRATEEALALDPDDFRLWVCLHEVTHRLQFTAVPWLADHVEEQVRAFASAGDLDASALLARLRGALSAAVDALRGKGDTSLLEIVQTPEQREVLDRVQGFMSLVEGHAEWVMDGVGPDVIPSLRTIRRRFDARRRSRGPLDTLVRRLLGLDLKMRQYAEGAVFVRAVVAAVGVDGFNRVWESAETLPSRAEIADPDAWIARVHGPRVAA